MSTLTVLSPYRTLSIRLPLCAIKNKLINILKTRYFYIALSILIVGYILKKHVSKLKKYWEETGVFTKTKHFFIIAMIIIFAMKIKQFFSPARTSYAPPSGEADLSAWPTATSLGVISALCATAAMTNQPTESSEIHYPVNHLANNIAKIESQIANLTKVERCLDTPATDKLSKQEQLMATCKLTVYSFLEKNKNGMQKDTEHATLQYIANTVLPSIRYIWDNTDNSSIDPQKTESFTQLTVQTHNSVDLLSKLYDKTTRE